MGKINRARSLSADRHKAGAGFVRDKTHRQKLIVVAGPTSSGKSDIAIRLARRFNGEVISADSRQVYRGMDIGTGKVPRDKMTNDKFQMSKRQSHSTLGIRHSFISGGIRHWMLDIASPTRQYSVARFVREAQRAIRDITGRGKLPIVCGGTGFWIDALVYGQPIPDVRPDAKLRARLRKLSAAQLFARLKKLDPVRAANIDRHNPVRLIRALEIVLSTGHPVPPQINGSPYEPLYLGISKPLPELKRRIEIRLDARLKQGMVTEVRRLHDSGVSWKRLESFGLEYRRVAEYLQHKFEVRSKNGEIPPSSLGIRHSSFRIMREALLHDIFRYAKRQLTWWRRNPDIRWVNGTVRTGHLIKSFLG